MAARVSQLPVYSAAQLENTVNSYIANGFVVANRTPQSVTMMKRKEFNVLWALIGFFLCVLPLLIYAIVYATQSDQMVEIRVVDALPAPTSGKQMSPDGRWWWDGTRWQDADSAAPPGAQLSPDGKFWWDGARWRAIAADITPSEQSAYEEPPS